MTGSRRANTASTRSSATLHDVAAAAGVSLATASRVLNGSTRVVNEEFRKRVLDAAAELDYSPNLSAQAVARGTSTTVALLVADVADPYFSQIAAGVVREADREGLIVTMAATERDPGRELELVRALRGQRPRAMILAASRHDDPATAAELERELRAYESKGGRVAFISGGDAAFGHVPLENRAGAAALARALHDAGFRRFAAIGATGGIATADERLRGFAEGLADSGAGATLERTVSADFTRDGGYEGMSRLLAEARAAGDAGDRRDGPELVFAVNDVMAVGAMSALRDAGLTPGVEVAVAGFDDIPTARDVTPPLTTVRLPLEEIGRRALRLALGGEASGLEAPAEVMLRASTPPRG